MNSGFDLFLARHGETEWSLNGRHTGSTDLPLTARGEERAIALQSRLAVIDFAAVYSSPMTRALRTAEIAGFPSPTVTPLLCEFDYGDYEGLTTEQIHAKQPDWELYRDGCPGGESPQRAYARAQEFIDLSVKTRGPVLAFAHGHILRAITVAWMDLEIEAAARVMLDVATVSILRDGDHGRVLQVWNSL